MKTYALLILCFISFSRSVGAEKITAVYDEAVKYCHENNGRLPRIRELQDWHTAGKLTPKRFYWSSTCALEKTQRTGWKYRYGDCVSYWKPDFEYEMVMILDGQGRAKHHDPNSPEVKVVRCVKTR